MNASNISTLVIDMSQLLLPPLWIWLKKGGIDLYKGKGTNNKTVIPLSPPLPQVVPVAMGEGEGEGGGGGHREERERFRNRKRKTFC